MQNVTEVERQPERGQQGKNHEEEEEKAGKG